MDLRTGYPCHGSNYQRGRAQPVLYLVYHYVGAAGGGEANARYYHATPDIGASAHYFVGHASEGAEIWRSVPEADTAWHCGARTYRHPKCRNANSIGIELCCHQSSDGTWYIEEATLAAGAALGRDILARHGIPLKNVLRHYDVTGKLCPRPLIDEGAWAAFKKRLEGDETTYYQTIGDVPADYRPAVRKLLDAGALRGYGDGSIHVSEDLCRTAVVLDRLGLLDKGGLEDAQLDRAHEE